MNVPGKKNVVSIARVFRDTESRRLASAISILIAESLCAIRLEICLYISQNDQDGLTGVLRLISECLRVLENIANRPVAELDAWSITGRSPGSSFERIDCRE